jgi:uncharacterized protein
MTGEINMEDNIIDYIRYDQLIDQAMRQVVRTALEKVKKEGLQGEHHFLITFDTLHKGVSLPARLRRKYPKEMTIVLQHQFDDIETNEDHFSVVLSFDGIREKIVAPYDALISFADPGVKFGLKFNLVSELQQIEEDLKDIENVSKQPSSDISSMSNLNEIISKGAKAKKPKSSVVKKATKKAKSDNVISLDFHSKKSKK